MKDQNHHSFSEIKSKEYSSSPSIVSFILWQNQAQSKQQ